MIAESAIPARVALNLALEPVTRRRKDAPKARSTPVRTILTENKRRMVAPASSSMKSTITILNNHQVAHRFFYTIEDSIFGVADEFTQR